MAEAAQRTLPACALRVAIAIDDPVERARMSALVLELGHVVTDAANAEIVLGDSASPHRDIPAVIFGDVESDAAGVIAANASADQIDAALRAVAAGLTVRPMRMREPHFAAFDERRPAPLLTPRELEVLVALSEGASNKAVARRLDISQHTVKFHIESIFRKLGVATRAEAVAKGLRRGLVNL